MAVSRDQMHEHRQKYGVLYMVTVIGSLLPMMTMGGYILRSFNGLATDIEMNSAIGVHVAAGMHPAGEKAIEKVAKQSECRWLDDKIDGLEDLIWEMQQEGGNANRIHDKEQDLRKYTKQYDKKNCSNVRY